MDIGRIPLFEALTKRMNWLTQRQTVLAENVANANTPGYVGKDLKEPDFGGLVAKANGALQMAATQPGHISPSNNPGGGQVVTVADDKSLDGNGVSLEAQMMKVSTNASDYAVVSALYKQNVTMIKMALGGGGSG
jgi:flagellar basal-body rod protein FlgB